LPQKVRKFQPKQAMTLPKYTNEEARARKARFAQWAIGISALVRKHRNGLTLNIPATILQRSPRTACLVCGHGIGRHECRRWKGEQQ